MLLVVGEKSLMGGYMTSFVRALCGELERRGIAYRNVQLGPGTFGSAEINALRRLRPTGADTWFLCYAQSHAIDYIRWLPGKKYAHVHGLFALPYEPSRLEGYNLEEPSRLSQYDGLFVNTQFAREVILKQYPNLRGTVTVSGFPAPFDEINPHRRTRRDAGLVVINQRFALDKCHILKVELAQSFIRNGLKVKQLLPGTEERFVKHADVETRSLFRSARELGIRFVFSGRKSDYYRELAGAGCSVQMSLSETLSVATRESLYLGVPALVPDMEPFRDYVPGALRYPPYNLEEVERLVGSLRRKDVREVDNLNELGSVFEFHHPQNVVTRYLTRMARDGALRG